MSLLYPNFLFALFTLSIPVLIHLFHFRRFKKVYFSDTRFLRSVKLEKKTKNRLKHLILLILRMLALTALILAFCQPYIRDDSIGLTGGRTAVSIYIDNSLSMENIKKNNSLFEDAKKLASSIISSYNENDEFNIITNDFLEKHQRFFNSEESKNLVKEVSISPFKRTISDIVDRQKSLLKFSGVSNKVIYLISDFQKSTAEFEKLKKDTSVVTFCTPLYPNSTDNIFIDSVWFESPIIKFNQSMTLKISLQNRSDDVIEGATLYFLLNGKQKGIANYSVPANQNTIINIPFTVDQSGWNKGIIRIEDYPLTFDDEYFFRFYVPDIIRVLSLNDEIESIFLKALFSNDNYFEYDEVSAASADHSVFNKYDLIIINELNSLSSGLTNELIEYVSEGGNLVIFPASSEGININEYNNLLSGFGANHIGSSTDKESRIFSLNLDHPLMKDIFEEVPENMNFPNIKRYFQRSDSIRTLENKLIIMENGMQFLSFMPFRQGNLFVYSIPLSLEWSNFPKHALFVPVMYKTALYRKNNLSFAASIGKDRSFELTTKFIDPSSSFEIIRGEKSFIPEYRLSEGNIDFFIDEEFNKSGFYNFITKGESNKEEDMPVIAFNYDRTESYPEHYSGEDLELLASEKGIHLIKASSGNTSSAVKTANKGKALWKYFLIIALIMLLAEIVIIRFWKS